MTHTQQPVPSGIHLSDWDRPIHTIKFRAYDSRWGAKLTEQQSNALIPGVLEAEAWREAAELANDGGLPIYLTDIGCATGATIRRMSRRLLTHDLYPPKEDAEAVTLFLLLACEAETEDYPDGWFGHFAPAT